MGRSIFLTGAAGFLGRRVLERFASSGDRVVCLIRRPDALAGVAHAGAIETVVGDLNEPASWASALVGIDTVIHLAAVTGKARASEYFRVNGEGSRLLLEASRAAGVGSLLLVSSIAVKFPDKQRYFYAQSKRVAEEVVTHGDIPWTILRPTMIFGPQAPVLEGLARLAGAPVVPVFGNGRAATQPIHVDDVANAVHDLLLEDRFRGETIELGGPRTLSIEELLLLIRRLRFGKGGRVVHLPLGSIRTVLGALEPMLLRVLPLTAGQLASFANDGAAEPSEFTDARRAALLDLEVAIAEPRDA